MDLIFLNNSTHTFVNSELLSYTQESKFLLIVNNIFFSFVASNFPSEILEGRLYLGDAHHANDKTIL